ncbi:MAG: hypothetical protein H0T73_12975 [Ardenticatenales bacterium]|nr:hypothetical protein [Ardenticatenales bacterium]
MATDLTRFPFPYLPNPTASTLTEALAHPATSSGFVVLALMAKESEKLIDVLYEFATAARRASSFNGLRTLRAFRQLRRDELGGAVPFDQSICEKLLELAGPMATLAQQTILSNPLANWVLLLDFDTTDHATIFVDDLHGGDYRLDTLADGCSMYSVGAFRNIRQYGRVLYDPNLIQCFTLFPAPGTIDLLWQSWQDALPWFFEIGGARSSLPLLAMRPEQTLLLVNHAHWDSMKPFLHGGLYDRFLHEQVLKGIWVERGATLPHTFFCKIAPV